MTIEGINGPRCTQNDVVLITSPILTEAIVNKLCKLRDNNPVLAQVSFGNQDGTLLVHFDNGKPSFADGLKDEILDALRQAEEMIASEHRAAQRAAEEAEARRKSIIDDAAKAFGVVVVDDHTPHSKRRKLTVGEL